MEKLKSNKILLIPSLASILISIWKELGETLIKDLTKNSMPY